MMSISTFVAFSAILSIQISFEYDYEDLESYEWADKQPNFLKKNCIGLRLEFLFGGDKHVRLTLP